MALAVGIYFFINNKSAIDPNVSEELRKLEITAPLTNKINIENKDINLDTFEADPKTVSKLHLSNTNGVQLLLDKQDEKTDGSDLVVSDKDNKVIFKETDVFHSSLFKNSVLYQKNNEGVFKYDIDSKQKSLIVSTKDAKSFENIAMIDDQRYFFVQTATGKIGFGKINSNETITLDEKPLKTNSNYANLGAFKFAGVSPNSKFAATLDMNMDKDKVTLKIFPTDAKSKKDLYFESPIAFIGRSLLPGEEIFTWSDDSKYLIVGDNAEVFDLEKKAKVYSLENKFAKAKLSFNKQNLLVRNFDDKKTFIRNLNDNKEIQVAENISDIRWIDDENLVFIIGLRLYVFNLKDQKVESISEDRVKYEILSINHSDKSIFIKKDDEIQKLQIK